jgi:hypothetical protein
MKVMLDEETRQNKQMEKEINSEKTYLDACRRVNRKGKLETPSDRERELPRTVSRQLLPIHDHQQKLYSEVVVGCEERKFKLTLGSKDNQTPDMIKRQIKKKVKPTEISVGITSLKTLRDGRVIIAASSKKETEALGEKIWEKCGEELEVNIQKLRDPRLVLLNIPEDITLENVKGTLTLQNSELDLKEGNSGAKFCYTTKRGTRNLVIEVDSGT